MGLQARMAAPVEAAAGPLDPRAIRLLGHRPEQRADDDRRGAAGAELHAQPLLSGGRTNAELVFRTARILRAHGWSAQDARGPEESDATQQKAPPLPAGLSVCRSGQKLPALRRHREIEVVEGVLGHPEPQVLVGAESLQAV